MNITFDLQITQNVFRLLSGGSAVRARAAVSLYGFAVPRVPRKPDRPEFQPLRQLHPVQAGLFWRVQLHAPVHGFRVSLLQKLEQHRFSIEPNIAEIHWLRQVSAYLVNFTATLQINLGVHHLDGTASLAFCLHSSESR